MIEIYPADSRFTSQHDWLHSNFSFSFAEYYDPNNLKFGPLRVLNDDIIQPARGFGMHPHQEMEIVSIVLSGYLQHEDSHGHRATTTFGEIQRMSAGTGIFHSEMNPSNDEEVNLLQLWFLPDTRGLTPSYEKTSYEIAKMKNNLLPVVTKKPTSAEVAHIHQDLTIYLSQLEAGQELTFKQAEGRRIFLFVLDGELVIHGGLPLKQRDSARITEIAQLTIIASTEARFMLIDLP